MGFWSGTIVCAETGASLEISFKQTNWRKHTTFVDNRFVLNVLRANSEAGDKVVGTGLTPPSRMKTKQPRT